MKRLIKLGIFTVAVPVILVAMYGIYSLVSPAIQRDARQFSTLQLVKPVFAQAVPFPDDEAGISAYVKFPVGSVILMI